MDKVRLRADWQAKAEEWLRKASARLIDELDELPWSTRRPRKGSLKGRT
jgi:hypothetical protein